MRLAFWRAGRDETAEQRPVVQRAVPGPAPVTERLAATPAMPGDLDVRALGHALLRNKRWIIVPTLLATVLSIAAVNLVTPRYKSEARILIDGRENIFLRPNGERNDEQRAGLDAEAVTSQVQLLLSRDLARDIIKKNKLATLPEFDPVLGGLSPLKSLLALFGIGRDPFSLTPEERVLDAYFDRYTAYAVDKSRVIVIEFQSRDPDLAAEIGRRLRNGYIREPSVAVEIDSYRPFFILGEVAAPGQYPYVPNISVESAIAIAGGFSPRARRDNVTLTHADGADSMRAVVPLGTPLSPGDTVLVGERWF